MGDTVTVTIDGKKAKAHKGETILELATRMGIHIPTLCYHPRLPITGACRVCVVEVEGARSLVASCAFPIGQEGMVIKTATERVIAARRMAVELLLSSGDHNCLLCESNGRCELQDLVYELKIEQPRFPSESPGHSLDDTNPMIFRDLNKCILCGRCVRAFNEVQVNQVIDFGFRGARTKIVTAEDRSYGDSNCVFCGECVQVCPVGALVENKARFAGRPWDVTKVPTTCTYCGTGCTIDLNIVNGRLQSETGQASSSVSMKAIVSSSISSGISQALQNRVNVSLSFLRAASPFSRTAATRFTSSLRISRFTWAAARDVLKSGKFKWVASSRLETDNLCLS